MLLKPRITTSPSMNSSASSSSLNASLSSAPTAIRRDEDVLRSQSRDVQDKPALFTASGERIRRSSEQSTIQIVEVDDDSSAGGSTERISTPIAKQLLEQFKQAVDEEEVREVVRNTVGVMDDPSVFAHEVVVTSRTIIRPIHEKEISSLVESKTSRGADESLSDDARKELEGSKDDEDIRASRSSSQIAADGHDDESVSSMQNESSSISSQQQQTPISTPATKELDSLLTTRGSRSSFWPFSTASPSVIQSIRDASPGAEGLSFDHSRRSSQTTPPPRRTHAASPLMKQFDLADSEHRRLSLSSNYTDPLSPSGEEQKESKESGKNTPVLFTAPYNRYEEEKAQTTPKVESSKFKRIQDSANNNHQHVQRPESTSAARTISSVVSTDNEQLISTGSPMMRSKESLNEQGTIPQEVEDESLSSDDTSIASTINIHSLPAVFTKTMAMLHWRNMLNMFFALGCLCLAYIIWWRQIVVHSPSYMLHDDLREFLFWLVLGLALAMFFLGTSPRETDRSGTRSSSFETQQPISPKTVVDITVKG